MYPEWVVDDDPDSDEMGPEINRLGWMLDGLMVEFEWDQGREGQ